MEGKTEMKIAVLCLPGLEAFMKDIVRHFASEYQVKTCYSTDARQIQNAILWADVVWLEWANQLAIGVTANPGLLNGKRVICRLHSYEVFEDFIERIDWAKIDDLLFVAPHIREIATRRIAGMKTMSPRMHVIPNGIDCDRVAFFNRNPGHRLAFIGNINYKKGPMLLLHAFRELVQMDHRYTLHVAGRFQNDRYALYFQQMMQEMNLEENIRLEGWIEDIPNWLHDKHYVVCTSVLEGHPVGIMEAMACGLKPLIHNFVGARGIYPDRFLWNTIPEFIRQATSGTYDSCAYRDFVKDNFSLNKQLGEIDRIVSGGRLSTSGTLQTDDGNAIGSPGSRAAADRENPTGAGAMHPKVRETLARCVRPGMDVLVVGGGVRELAEYIGSMDAAVVCVDESGAGNQDAQEPLQTGNVTYYPGPYEEIQLDKMFDLIAIIRVIESMPAARVPGFLATITGHIKSTAVIYLDIADGRYLRHAHACADPRDGDNCIGYPPDEVLALFAGYGLQTYHVEFYGDDVPVHYNGYLFTTDSAFSRACRTTAPSENIDQLRG